MARTVDALWVVVRMHSTILVHRNFVSLASELFVASGAAEFSIFRQEVDFTKLFLDLLDPLGAVGEPVSVARGHHDRPTLFAWYDGNLN